MTTAGRTRGGTAGDEADMSPSARSLRERWFACSSALGWSAPAEWPDPSVDAVCVAVTGARGRKDQDSTESGARDPSARDARSEGGVERALARWAGARAGAGVPLAETLTDLAALHTAVASPADVPGPPTRTPESPSGNGQSRPNGSGPNGEASRERGPDGARLLRVVSLAWTDVACGELAETAAVDPLSGLASVRYLRTRLAEVYRGARARGTRVGDEHALVTATLPVHGWARVGPLVVAGEAAAVVFDAGESLAVVGRSTLVVLAPRAGLAERTRVLRRLLARRLVGVAGGPAAGPAPGSSATTPSVRIVGLPATHEGACALLERLRASEPSGR